MRSILLAFPAAAVLLLGACVAVAPSKDTAPTDDTDVVVEETDAPLDSDTQDAPTGPSKPVRPRDSDPPVESDTPEPPEDTAPVVPPGPVDPPVADAGPDRQKAPLEWVNLDGTGSFDPGGLTPLRYRWTLIHRPAGSTALLVDKTKAKAKFWIDIAGTYEARLEVRNSAGVWDPTPDTMIVEAVPGDDFYVQLTWDAASDLDLHVLNESGAIFQNPTDCNFCNQQPGWYQSGRGDDPSLDWDVINGYGPETTTVDLPAARPYRVQVHYYGVGGATSCGGRCPRSEATLRFYFQGLLVDTMVRTLSSQGEVWDAAVFDGATSTVTHVDTVGQTQRTQCN